MFSLKEKKESVETIYQEAFAAYLNGDFSSAVTGFEKVALAGNTEAMYRLGEMYDMGQGVAVDPGKSYTYTSRAAESGNANAQTSMAMLYWSGYFDICKMDRMAAVEWLQKALEQNCETAVGVAMMFGICGYQYAPVQAADHFRRMLENENDDIIKLYLSTVLFEIGEKNGADSVSEELRYLAEDMLRRDIPIVAALWVVLSRMNSDKKEFSEEETALLKCGLEKNDVRCMVSYGILLLGSGDTETARKLFREAVSQKDPNGIFLQAMLEYADEIKNISDEDRRVQVTKKFLKKFNLAADYGCDLAWEHIGDILNSIVPENAAVNYFKGGLEGNTGAICKLGKMYADGFGRQKKDPRRAVSYFRDAIELNDTSAHVAMGEAYLNGEAVERDVAAAFGHFAVAARNGEALGMFHYGNMLYLGTFGFTDRAEGLQWIEKAAELKEPVAMYTYCQYTSENGMSAEQENMLEEAAELGFAEAQLHCGVMYLQKNRSEADREKAFSYFFAAAAQGNAEAMFWCGSMVQPHDPQEALRHFRLAAEMGDALAQYEMGKYFFESGDYIHAYPYLEKASQQGDADATMLIAKMYENGLGVSRDREHSEFLNSVAENQKTENR